MKEKICKNLSLQRAPDYQRKQRENFLANFNHLMFELEQAQASKNLPQLRKLAYMGANIAYSNYALASDSFELYPEFHKSNPNVELISGLVRNILLKAKERVAKLLNTPVQTNASFPRSSQWASALPPTTKIRFVHGGGLNFIINFLSGKEPGYPIDERYANKALGIQVHPFKDLTVSWSASQKSATQFYAGRSSKYTADYPAYLTGIIEAQFVESQKNDDEGGIRYEYVHCIYRTSIHPILPEREYEVVSPPPMKVQRQLVLFGLFKDKTNAYDAFKITDHIAEFLPSSANVHN